MYSMGIIISLVFGAVVWARPSEDYDYDYNNEIPEKCEFFGYNGNFTKDKSYIDTITSLGTKSLEQVQTEWFNYS